MIMLTIFTIIIILKGLKRGYDTSSISLLTKTPQLLLKPPRNLSLNHPRKVTLNWSIPFFPPRKFSTVTWWWIQPNLENYQSKLKKIFPKHPKYSQIVGVRGEHIKVYTNLSKPPPLSVLVESVPRIWPRTVAILGLALDILDGEKMSGLGLLKHEKFMQLLESPLEICSNFCCESLGCWVRPQHVQHPRVV